MKQYVVDQLRPTDYEKLKGYMDNAYGENRMMEGVWWIPLDPEHENAVQREHPQCSPFVFAVELSPDKLACELLIRTLNRMRCDCMGYADDVQTLVIIRFLDRILDELSIKV